MKRDATRRYGEIALVAICSVVAAAIVVTVVRRGGANFSLYGMLGLVLLALLTFIQPGRPH